MEMEQEFRLDGIVPWGRRLWEYRAFFALEEADLRGAVLDVGSGPSSFAAEASVAGARVTATDPLYALSGDAIAQRFEETRGAMMEGLRQAHYRFRWSHYGSPDAIEKIRCEALALFLADYQRVGARRYVEASLPGLPFGEGAFRLALSSHLLFLYGDDLDFAFHLDALHELLRVADEVRVFPLINLDGRPSSHLPGVLAHFAREGMQADLVPVPYEFQRDATKMLRLRR